MSRSCVVLAVLCAVGWVSASVFVYDRVCESDDHCRWYECCRPKLSGEKKICRVRGGDRGEVCGGAYFCGTCRPGLVCQPVVTQVGGNCLHPANGTCEEAPSPSSEQQQQCPVAGSTTLGPTILHSTDLHSHQSTEQLDAADQPFAQRRTRTPDEFFPTLDLSDW